MASSAPSRTPKRAQKTSEGSDVAPPQNAPRPNLRPFTLSGPRWRPFFAAAVAFASFTSVALLQESQPLPHPAAEIFSLAFWQYPIVTNEINRLPWVSINGNRGPNFNAAWIAPDGKGIWIAGDKGILLHSPDGGTTWIQLQPPLQPRTASASIDRRSWSLFPVVEAAAEIATIQSAPASGTNSPSKTSPNQNPAQQQSPAPPTSVTGSVQPVNDSTAHTTQSNPSINDPANPLKIPAPTFSPGAGNFTTSSPRVITESLPSSQQTTPARSRQTTASSSAQNALKSGPSNSTDLVPCQLQGAEILGVYFRSESLGYIKYETQSGDPNAPLTYGATCSTSDGGESWTYPILFQLGDDRQKQTHEIDADIEKSGSTSANLPNGTVIHASAGMRAIQFADSRVGVAVGEAGAAIKTVDGGHQWFPVFQGPEGQRAAIRPSLKFPAPWYYLSWIVVGLIAVPALRKPTGPELKTEETIANIGVSDRPLEPTDPDPLGFRNLALSISRFLRNENTIAPITIAITGDWGTGKSSIMNLLRRDLAARGFRPIWFNAWHNQTEDDLFATILQSLRKQGVPQWWDLDYLPFRMRLLVKRWRSRWPAATLLLAVIAFLAGIEWDHLKDLSAASFFASFRTWDSVIESLKGLHGTFWTLLVCVLVAAREFYRSLKAFGVDPASLLASKSGATNLADLEKQTSLRQRFSEELREVTEALGIRRRMVLFIDDLDRCLPENIRVALEAINFIVTSGDCYIIMGLARRPVEAGVGLSFDKVAAEMTWSLATKDESAEDLAKRKRWQFSRQYLDKLINIEIPARPVSNAHMEDLVLVGDPPKGSSSPLVQTAARTLRIALPVLISLTLIAATCTSGLLVGRYNLSEKPLPPPPVKQDGAASRPSQPASPTANGSSASQQGSAPTAFTFTLERPASTAPGLPTYGLPLLAVAVLLYIGWRVLSQQEEVLIRDSPAFRRALEIWDTLIVQTHATPRSTKRFMNRVRCLAMRLRPFAESRSRWSLLFQSPDAFSEETKSVSTQLPESMLVALSAIYDIAPEIVRNDSLYTKAMDANLVTSSEGEVEIDQRIQKTYWDALQKHRAQFVSEWPPNPEQRILFLNMCADVTVRG